jgi:hypothetical protein
MAASVATIHVQTNACAAAKAYLSNTLEWLNLWQSNAAIGSGPVSNFDAGQNHSTLKL